MLELDIHQSNAVKKLHTGSVLCGDTGSGKTRTALAYYYIRNGGSLTNSDMPMDNPKDLYVITTAATRDKKGWDVEMSNLYLSKDPDLNMYSNKVVVDSWQNIQKYKNVKGAFFIFDEQRVTGKGPWVTSFIAIAKHNEWILLSATPGDNWIDWVPIFMANGFIKSRGEFNARHVQFSRFYKFPKIIGYYGESTLHKYRKAILVELPVTKPTISHDEDIIVAYDKEAYKKVYRYRWDIWNDTPIENVSKLCQSMRRVVNEDPSRQVALLEIVDQHPRVIIFYNYDYELEILRSLEYGEGFEIAEWNGHKHEPIPDSDKWVYLVNYGAGAEGWNCITTDTMIFYSQNYSYKIMHQAKGRIDRRNTKFKDLYFYHLKSKSSIDVAIHMALEKKKDFNESMFINRKNGIS